MNILAENLSFRYEGCPAVQDISLSIPEGTLTVLCGVNGSGKSTLLRLLAGLEQPSSGRIIYGDPADTDRQTPQSGISMVFQQPETQLFAGSVSKDIEYGLEQRGVPGPQRTERVRSSLARTGLSYDEFAGRSPFLLSGGEKRRVCIAGAIATRPGLLILDEPTAGLDPQTAQAMLEMVQELRANGMTLIIGTHDLDSFLPVADSVIVMKQGSVQYNGPAPALAADPAILSGAGLTPPAYISIGHLLMQRGLLESSPDSLEALLAGLEKHPLPIPPVGSIPAAGHPDAETRRSQDPSYSGYRRGAGSLPERPLPAGAEKIPAAAKTESGQRQTAPGRHRRQGLDPRVKWLGMILGSVVVLGMNTLLPLLITAGLLAGLVAAAGIPWRRTVRFFRPFLLMFLFFWLLSALSWSSPDFTIGPVGFSNAGIARGGISVLRFLLLIVLGFLFTETTTGAPLREGLEWGIAPLKLLGIRTRNWSLAVSVTLQFVPWILGKLDQLQLALHSRGRRARGLARWTPRQITLIIVPLLILVLAMGDELATAIESRGYDPAKQRTPVYQLAWNKRDTLAALCILAAAALLWWTSAVS